MNSIRRFVSYYVRSALPFLSGIAYGIFLVRWDHPLWLQVLAGLALVVVGPFAIRIVLTLIVEALRGVPDHDARREPSRRSPLGTIPERHAPLPPARVESRPALGEFLRGR